ncbi:uncharacterized protein LOC117239439 [Bombus vosnesenskii]|uniref:Uncharacterized protein LOC117239439 n=1 Tax=Bombus vosnesenskii TaxID=207650 RepID=A0A6J3L5I6_9HYME|nr:uncharacterized protein LOC117239439 [Bombus vosnesenskii]XP_033360888.1 uncharacterized protein LOC117239439 [Bombus vosnesenskii]
MKKIMIKMSPVCAVPDCKSGSNCRKKYSLFKTPKNLELRKKWEKAIPGITELKQWQLICEKHFIDEYIIKKFVQRDYCGNIISEIMRRPYLRKGAVPTIFSNSNASSIIEEKEHKLPSSSSINALEEELYPKVSNETVVSISDTDLMEISSKDDSEMLVDEKYVNDEFTHDKDSLILIINSNDGHFIEHNYALNNFSKTVDNACTDSLLLSANCHNRSSIANTNALTDSSNVSIEYASEVAIDNTKTKVPKGWGVSEKVKRFTRYLLFTHTITEIKNNVDVQVLEKYIILNCSNGTARYFIREKEINNENIPQFNLKIINTRMLVDAMTKFEKMHICEGLGSIDSNLLRQNDSCENILNHWRHSKCVLLTKYKKCDYCKKLKRIIMQRRIDH